MRRTATKLSKNNPNLEPSRSSKPDRPRVVLRRGRVFLYSSGMVCLTASGIVGVSRCSSCVGAMNTYLDRQLPAPRLWGVVSSKPQRPTVRLRDSLRALTEQKTPFARKVTPMTTRAPSGSEPCLLFADHHKSRKIAELRLLSEGNKSRDSPGSLVALPFKRGRAARKERMSWCDANETNMVTSKVTQTCRPRKALHDRPFDVDCMCVLSL